MYQEDHGIIHNTFLDRLLNKTIGMGLYFINLRKYQKTSSLMLFRYS